MFRPSDSYCLEVHHEPFSLERPYLENVLNVEDAKWLDEHREHFSAFFPVMIGSTAQECHGRRCVVRDIDCLHVQKIDMNRYYYTPPDVTILGDKLSNWIIFLYSNWSNHKSIIKTYTTYLVPHLKLLYAIYKSHIHRILPLTGIQDKNIDIWHKHMKSYTWIRNKLGYKELDEIMFHDQLGALRDPNSVKDPLDRAMLLVYKHRFLEVCSRVGDTKSIDRPESEFFNDTVPRLIEHDELHARVATMCRGTRELLFEKFKKKDDPSASMDRIMFHEGDHNDKLGCVTEELMVLLLERKWLLEMDRCYKRHDRPYRKTNIDVQVKEYEMDETIAHFTTNLCGNGQWWLRRWVLDHYNHFITYPYDLVELCKVGIKIVYSPEDLERIGESQKPTSWDTMFAEFKKTLVKNRQNISRYVGGDSHKKVTVMYTYGDKKHSMKFHCKRGSNVTVLMSTDVLTHIPWKREFVYFNDMVIDTGLCAGVYFGKNEAVLFSYNVSYGEANRYDENNDCLSTCSEENEYDPVPDHPCFQNRESYTATSKWTINTLSIAKESEGLGYYCGEVNRGYYVEYYASSDCEYEDTRTSRDLATYRSRYGSAPAFFLPVMNKVVNGYATDEGDYW